MKKITSFLMAGLLCISAVSAPTAMAAQPNGGSVASPNELYSRNVNAFISLSGKTVTCTSTVDGKNGVTTKIVINQTLQKKMPNGFWDNYYTWSKTFNSTNASYVNTYDLSENATYRTCTAAYCYSGSSWQLVYGYSDEVTY